MLKEPFLSQERKIEGLIKFHENEIKRLKTSVCDIYFNSGLDLEASIPRQVYGIHETDTNLEVLEIGAIQDFPRNVQEMLLTGKEWRKKKKKDINESDILKTEIANKVDYSVFDKTVHQLKKETASLKGFISQLQDAMILKADKDDLISQINVCECGVKIKGKNIQIDGDVTYFEQLSGRKLIFSEDGIGLIKPESVADEDKIISGTLNSNKMDIINIKEEK